MGTVKFGTVKVAIYGKVGNEKFFSAQSLTFYLKVVFQAAVFTCVFSRF